jgi:hypothetical protein
MWQAQGASIRSDSSARLADHGTRWRARRRTILAPLLAVILVLVTACGPGGAGNGGGTGIGDGDGNGTGGPGDAGGGQVADLGGESGVTALIDGVRFTATENAWAWSYTESQHFALMAHGGEDAADGSWVVTGALAHGPQACDTLAVMVGVQLPVAEDGYHLALDCTIEVDAYEVGDELFDLGTLIAITGRFAGTLREFHEGVGFAGPIRVVTNGVFDIEFNTSVEP